MKGDIVHKALWIAICVLASAVAVASSVKRPVAFDDLEGTRTDQTGTTTFLALTADARWLAAEKNGRLHVYDVKARRCVKDLGEGLNPAWSPDGARLAFYSNRSGSLQDLGVEQSGRPRRADHTSSRQASIRTLRHASSAASPMRCSSVGRLMGRVSCFTAVRRASPQWQGWRASRSFSPTPHRLR